jgi:leader peptidase (prepilin peptidase) / N-methyltransferase
MVTVMLVVLCAVLGLLVGSFLNVVIARVPLRQSVVRPRSRCPGCTTQLAERDNVPVLSWLLLRGRCRTCAERIPVRYPLVEAGTAVLFAMAAARFGADWALPGYLLFFAVLVAVSVIDLEHFLVPNRIVYPTVVASVPLLAVAALLGDDGDRFVRALLGALVAAGGLLVIHLISPRGMGMGDVKLAVLLGLYLGWLSLGHVLLGLLLGFVLGSVVGLALLATGLRGRKDHVPFAPFLAAGAVVAVLAGRPLLDWYLG